MATALGSTFSTTELCRLSLDYAWLHTIANIFLVGLFMGADRQKALLSSHCFGVFAMIMDWGLMYIVRGSRTLTYAPQGETGPFPYVLPGPYPVKISGVAAPPMPPLTPSGTFAFFLWFDYLGALGMLLFAFCLFEDLLAEAPRRRGRLDCFTLLFVPLLFWSAPVLAPLMGLDGRVLLLTRPSPKGTYVKMLAAFGLPLLAAFPLKAALRVYCAGVACGCVHHAALFYHGMRGYDDVATLLATLATEWPALVVAVFATTALVQRLWKRCSVKASAAVGAPLLVLAAAALWKVEAEEVIVDMLPYIPGEWMHNLGTRYFAAQTCGRPGRGCLRDEAVLVMAAAAKGGAMLAAKLVYEVSLHCGICLSGGTRGGPGIPGEVEAVPSFEGGALLAIINMRGWPGYVQGMARPHRCVAFARDPEERLRSAYLYARSGGEYWVRSAGIMRRLEVANTTESLEDFWEIMGRGYLQQSHEYLRFNEQQGCEMVRYRGLKSDYNGTVVAMLKAWGVVEGQHRDILEKVQKYDFGRKSVEALKSDPHHSSSKFDAAVLKEVARWLKEKAEVQEVLARHRRELSF